MITRGGNAAIMQYNLWFVAATSDELMPEWANCKDINGNVVNELTIYSARYGSMSATFYSTPFNLNYDPFEAGSYEDIIFGSGNTPEDYEDYKLASRLSNITEIELGTPITTWDSDTHRYIRKVSGQYRNDNELSVTIAEVGLTHKFYTSTILLLRKVLDTPVTVPPNGIFDFSLSVNAMSVYQISH